MFALRKIGVIGRVIDDLEKRAVPVIKLSRGLKGLVRWLGSAGT
jgi:hypothetical protein